MADPPSAPQPPEPVPLPEDPIEAGPAAVGPLPGSGGVSPGGEYTYSVPLVVPDGRLGMQPQLSLEYSSSAGNGPVGVGWSLSGLSGIVRCSKTWAQDGVSQGVRFDRAIDRFCLDGQRLKLVGSIGGAPVEYGGNDTVYRTETDSFAHIVAKATPATVEQGPDWFEVRTKAGRILQYDAFSANQESSLVSVSGTNAGSSATVSRRVAWLLTKERDRSGNEIRYEYLQPVANEGMFLPWKIRYTYDSSANPQAYRLVEFVYVDRPTDDRPVVFQTGVRSTLTKQLDMIKMSAPNPVETQQVWSYQLGYHVSTQSSRLMLEWVRRCGYLNTCTQKKTFTYGDSAAPTFVKRSVATSEQLFGQPEDMPQAQVLDLNGDGATDVLYSRGLQEYQPPGSVAPHHIRLGTRAETGTVPLAVRYTDENVLTASRPIWTMRGTDIDSDGSIDIGIPVTEGLPPQQVIKFYQWDDTQHVLVPKNMVTPGGHYTELADLNGDGRVDVLPIKEITQGQDTRFTVTAQVNTGSGFTPATQSQYFDYGCPARLADLDSDGRMELVGNPRMPLEDLPIEIDEEEGIESWPGKSRGAPRPTHPTLDVRCKNGSETYAVRLDDAGALTVAPGFTTFNGARAYRVPPMDMASQVTTLGDFNGDGLTDALLAPRVGGWSKAVFNTGNGLAQVGPSTWVANGGAGAGGYTYPPDLRVGDLTGDGRDDVLVFTDSGITLKVSRGDGSFADRSLLDQTGFPHFAGIKVGDMGRTMTQLGDFNADGRLDLLRWGALGDIDILEQDTYFGADMSYAATDRMLEVGDENAPLPMMSVEYSMSWTEHPERYTDYLCGYPLVCLRGGMPVVRRTKSYGHLETAASAPGAYLLNYTYEDPVVTVHGRGGLGFGTFRVWDPQRPSETITTFQNRAHLDEYYSGAGRPKIVQTVTPIMTQDQVGQQLGTAQARVARTVNTFETRQLNGGANYAVLGPDSLVREWEEQVSISWASISGSSNTEHIFDVETSPSNILRTTNVDLTFSNDDYGNLTTKASSIDGGVSGSVTTTYENRPTSPTDPALWLIGLPTRTAVTSTAVDATAVTRTTDRQFDTLGRLDTVWVEKDHADARLRNTTTHQLAADGVLLSTIVSSPPLATGQQMPHRQVNYEYGRPFGAAQPDERIHPSQVWSSHVPEQYRPSVWTTTHPAYGIPLVTMDINGVVSTSKYDDLGRLRRTDADGAGTTTMTYQQRLVDNKICGLIVTATGPNSTTKTQVDRGGRVVEVAAKAFDGTFSATATGYDKFGRTVTTTPPAPEGTTTTTYDSLDRVTKVTGPDGKFSTADHTFLTTLTTDPEGFQKRATRDVSGRTVATTDLLIRPGLPTLEITTGYQHAPFDQVKTVTDAASHTTTMSYDLRGRRVQIVSPDRGRTDTTYFGTGEPFNETHYDTRNFITFGYDDLGRVTSSTSEDGLSTFTWDTSAHGIGKRAYAVSPDNIRTDFRYDEFGRSAGIDYIDTVPSAIYSIDNHYDSAGRLLSQELPGPGGVSRFTLQYDYNAAGHLAAMRYAKPGSSTLLPMWDVLTRKPNGALDTATLGTGAGMLTLSNSYQPNTGRLSSQLANKGSTPVHHRSYGYYDNGLVESRDDTASTPSPRTEQFSYDSLSRLTGWNIVLPPPNSNQEDRVIESDYGYDSIGNLTSVSRTDLGATTTENRTHGKPDGSQPHTLTSLTGPNAQTLVYDSEGRQTTGGGRGVTYTGFDLPKTVVKGGQTTTYYYDAFGQRIKEVGPAETTVYVPGVYEKRTSGSATKHVYHVPGVEGANAQAVYDGTDTTVGYQLTDALGSISTAADTNGDVTGRFYFDPFGLRINVDGTPFTGSTGDVHHGFTGHEHDGDLNLINMNGRVEDPSLKNFLTSDPLSTAGGNPYAYVDNSPLNLTDPSGFRPCDDGMLKGKHQYTGDECNNLSGTGVNNGGAAAQNAWLGIATSTWMGSKHTKLWAQANAATRSSDAAKPAITPADVKAFVEDAWGWMSGLEGPNVWAEDLRNANCLETCPTSASTGGVIAWGDGNPNDRRQARAGYEKQYDQVEITTLAVGLALYGAGVAGGAAYKAFLLWCAANAASCAFLPFLLSAIGPPGSPGPVGAVNVFANNQRTILSRYNRLANLESIGGNAGGMSRAVNGVVDIATGEIVALGNVSQLPQRAHDMLNAGTGLKFSIVETLNISRSSFQQLPSNFAVAAKGASQTVTGQLNALVAWMQQTQPTMAKP